MDKEQQKPASVAEFREAARKILPRGKFDYIENTSGSGKTHAANLEAFSNFQFVPRVLRGIDSPSTETTILGSTAISSPIMIAPTAWHRMFSKRGETDTYEAAKEFGVPFVMSSFSTCYFSDLEKDSPLKNTWYQLLVYNDKGLMREYIAKAEASGCTALVLTVDAPLGCSMCLNLKNDPEVLFPTVSQLPLLPKSAKQTDITFTQYYKDYLNRAQNWNDIADLISTTKIPVILKGIMSYEDLYTAKSLGAKGAIISNHGGRQLDGATSTLNALVLAKQELHRSFEAKGKFDIYMDGGIRTGADVFKAIALGAKAVLVGRPVLYGLSVDGKEGVKSILRILDCELKDCMHLSGCEEISKITADRLAAP
jgi:isopentenyl diphosphate isomerase/L-lactate dehydrogenase-like FMN-dependent dehydrogenase